MQCDMCVHADTEPPVSSIIREDYIGNTVNPLPKGIAAV